jgi:hypothetical protein
LVVPRSIPMILPIYDSFDANDSALEQQASHAVVGNFDFIAPRAPSHGG